ncbi:glycosyltransferase [Streptomyces sp. NPDC050617]|uniref:glycosyltransferase n=1 Tax=Streptomyces sp. NPDC050617 TaxID=3154628 RepID=UPI0034138FFB
MKIAFLLHNAYGIGGANRTTFNLAAALADRHQVEIASMTRHRDEPGLALDPRVRIVPLAGLRPPGGTDQAGPDDAYAEGAGTAGAVGAAGVAPLAAERHLGPYNRLAERLAADYLRRCAADVIIGTRPSVNIHLARFGPRRALRIAQEHLSLDAHPERLRRELARNYRSLDALITTTDADAAAYRERMALPGVRILAVPDSVPEPPGPPSGGTAKVVVAAGQLARGKRFDLLIEAFSAVAAKRPDWRLRIYGGGAERDRLELLIAGLGLRSHVELMGPHAPIEAEFAQASLAAFASETESFGVTIIEAMRCGLPVVSTDCPHGPAEIIRDGVDGLLVPTGDGQALASALLDLIGDAPRRRAMAAAALDGSRRFDPAPIARGYERLFAELAVTRRRRAVHRAYARLRAAVAARNGAPDADGARPRAAADGAGTGRRTNGGDGDSAAGARGAAPARPGGAAPRGTVLRWTAPHPDDPRCAAAAEPPRARPTAQGRTAYRAAVDGAAATAQRRTVVRAARQSARRRERGAGATAGRLADVRASGPRRGAVARLGARRGALPRLRTGRRGVTPLRTSRVLRTRRVPRTSGALRTSGAFRTRRVVDRLFARRRGGSVWRGARWGTGVRGGARSVLLPRARARARVRVLRGDVLRRRAGERAAGLERAGHWGRVVARLLTRSGEHGGGRTATDAAVVGQDRLAFLRLHGQPAAGSFCGTLANPRFPRLFGGPGPGACGEPG